MTQARFAFTQDHLRNLCADALKSARSKGASATEIDVSEGYGLSVSVRKGEVENIEHNRDKGLSVSLYLGTRRGYASTSDFSKASIDATVAAAVDIARFTAEDDCAGLADPALLAKNVQDPQLLYPWDINVDDAARMAVEIEDAAFKVSKLIRNSEGAAVGAHHMQFAYANSNGFTGGYASTRHSLSCSVIAARTARDRDGMQRDDWYASARDAADFPKAATVGDYAARRALAKLGGKRLSTRQCPVLFEAPLAIGLVGALVAAASGGNLYRKTTFLVDALGQQIFPKNIEISEDPDVPKGFATGPFDDEGVATRARKVVEAGVLKGYFLSSYSARKLKMQSTGNAGGCHNMFLEPTVKDDFAAMLKRLGTGFLVTDLMGQGVNYVTGDYSRGAAGYWVQNGEIVHAVEEVTIAGNMKDMFKGIVAAGSDLIKRGSMTAGSVLIDRMTIAGD